MTYAVWAVSVAYVLLCMKLTATAIAAEIEEGLWYYPGQFRSEGKLKKRREAHWGHLILIVAGTLVGCLPYGTGKLIHLLFTSRPLRNRPNSAVNFLAGAGIPRAEKQSNKIKALEERNAKLEEELGLQTE